MRMKVADHADADIAAVTGSGLVCDVHGLVPSARGSPTDGQLNRGRRAGRGSIRPVRESLQAFWRFVRA